MAVKLNKTRRWYPVFKYLQDTHNIVVNFSSTHCGYIAAYRYVCKDKPLESVVHSPHHANLATLGSLRTKNAMKQFSSNAIKSRSAEPTSSSAGPTVCKPKRLSNTDIAEFLVSNNIKSENELMEVAKGHHDSGERDIYNFIMNKSPKGLSNLVNTTWKMQNAPKIVELNCKSRMDILQEYVSSDSACNDNNNSCEWFKCAKEALKNKRINLYTFADAVRQCIKYGRQKRNNIMLVGPTNCGKSFLLDPLELIFKTFVNPSSTSYAWVGLDEFEVVYLNDFRYSQEFIKWSEFLLLLEGQTVNLPRPKNQFSSDLRLPREKKMAFFATSKAPIEYIGKYNVKDDGETEMMSSRWKIFNFTVQISPENLKNITSCPYCFAKLVMQGSEMDN